MNTPEQDVFLKTIQDDLESRERIAFMLTPKEAAEAQYRAKAFRKLLSDFELTRMALMQAEQMEQTALTAKEQAERGKETAKIALSQANEYIDKIDGIIEEVGGVTVSCINTYEDIKRAIVALKTRAEQAERERDEARKALDSASNLRFFTWAKDEVDIAHNRAVDTLRQAAAARKEAL